MNKKITISSFIGTIGMFFLSVGCAADWILKVKEGRDWSGNLFFHPITGLFLILFLIISIIIILTRFRSYFTDNLLLKFENNWNSNLVVMILLMLLSVSLTLLTGIFMIENATNNASIPVVPLIIHLVATMSFGTCILYILNHKFGRIVKQKYYSNPDKLANYLSFSIIFILALFITLLILTYQ